MEKIRSIFFRGLVTFLPIAVTIYILYAGVLIVDNLLGTILRTFLPSVYIPGLGFILTLGLIFLFGLMLNSLFIGGLLQQSEKWLLAVPFIKTVYSPLRDLMNLFSQKGQKDLKSVVLVEVGDTGMQALGLVTRDSFRDLESLAGLTNDKVTVYIPWSYGVGGLTFLVPKSKIKAVDIPIDKAMSLALTAWIKSHEEDNKEDPQNG